MCQYDTQAAIPAIPAVATRRTAARTRVRIGTRAISSIVTSSASGGHAAITWLIGFRSAWSTFADTEAATPRTSADRTAHRTRLRDGSGMSEFGFGVMASSVPETAQTFETSKTLPVH